MCEYNILHAEQSNLPQNNTKVLLGPLGGHLGLCRTITRSLCARTIKVCALAFRVFVLSLVLPDFVTYLFFIIKSRVLNPI